MKNKGLLALGAILCIAFGFVFSMAVTPVTIIEKPTPVISEKIVYVNSTVDALDKEVFDKVFEKEIRGLELEDAASIAFAMEFDVKDLEDALEEELDNKSLTLDEIKSIIEDEDKENISIVKYGLNNADNTEVIVEKTFKVKYEDEESTDTNKVEVLARGVITFDEDDNEYNCEIKYSLI